VGTILLINPGLAFHGWSSDTKRPSPGSTCTRLGLAYLAGALKARGHAVELVDLEALPGWEEYERIVGRLYPDFIEISIHSLEFANAVEAARRAKTVVPRVKTIAAGLHPTMFPEECVEQDAFDYVLKGDGEISLPLLVEAPSRFPRVVHGETACLEDIPAPDPDAWPDFAGRPVREPFGGGEFRFPLVH
jgi:radical SAM superfamily enzyme YgiQ (UPF0313 family)